MRKANPYDFIVFDCDGVILDSNKIKTDGFRYALRQYPHEVVDAFVDYHKTNGGVSRQQKLQHFFCTMLKLEIGNAYNKALNEFAQYCHRALLDCSLVAGVKEYLQELNSLKVPIFIVSGGNEMEIKDVFKAKQIDHYFKGIYGNPKPKEQCLDELLASGIVSGKGLFYGDAALDYELATTSDMDFIFVYGVSEWNAGLNFCQENQLPCIKSFLDILDKHQC